jgi:hypothetical protein
LLGIDRRDISQLGRALATGISRIGQRTYYAHPEVQRRMIADVRATNEGVLNDLAELLKRAQEQLGLAELHEAASIAGGQSGSTVVRTYCRQSAGSALELCIVKSTDSEGDFSREIKGVAQAKASWMSGWVVDAIKSERITLDQNRELHRYIIISPLAFPPTSTSQHVPSLAEFVESRRIRICELAVDELGSKYSQYFHERTDTFLSARRLVEQLLAHWTVVGGEAWQDSAFWSIAGLPSCTDQCFQDGRSIRWNPLYLMSELTWLPTDNWPCRMGAQHGDLNARNILLSVDDATESVQLRVIDFEKWCQSICVLDICWLACYIVRAAAPRTANPEYWPELAGCFARAVLSPSAQATTDCGPFQFGIRLVRRLFNQFLPTSEPVLLNAITQQLRLTLAVTALVQSFYDTRALYRESSNVRTDDRRYRQLWALHFFRVAAIALDETCPLTHVAATASVTENLNAIFST